MIFKVAANGSSVAYTFSQNDLGHFSYRLSFRGGFNIPTLETQIKKVSMAKATEILDFMAANLENEMALEMTDTDSEKTVRYIVSAIVNPDATDVPSFAHYDPLTEVMRISVKVERSL